MSEVAIRDHQDRTPDLVRHVRVAKGGTVGATITETIRDDTPSSEDISAAIGLGAKRPAQAARVTTDPILLQRLAALQSSVDTLSQRVGRLESQEQVEALRPPLGDQPVASGTPSAFMRPIGNGGGGNGLGGGAGGGVGAPPVIPALTRQEGPTPIAGTGYMVTTATLSQDGRLDATTHTWSAQWLKGFTGGCFAVVSDGGGNILARTTIHQFGVNGTWIPGGPSDRMDNWTEVFTPDVAANARTLGIANFWDPQNRFFQDFVIIIQDAITVAELVANMCKQSPQICSTIASAL